MRATLTLTLLAAAALAACTTTDPYTGQQVRNNTGTGALAGAAGGALLGYLTNTNNSEEGRKNAMIGAGVGALAGAGIGQYMDRQQAELNRELAGTGIGVTRNGDDLVLNMPGDVTFASNSADVTPGSQGVLNDVAAVLNRYPQTLVDITGHADSQGEAAYNQTLSERRAASVADYLVSRGRLAPNRLYVGGRGEMAPIADNGTAEGRARNRRVEILIQPLTAG